MRALTPSQEAPATAVSGVARFNGHGLPRSPSRNAYGDSGHTGDNSLNNSLTSTSRPLKATEVYSAGKQEASGHALLGLVKPRVASAEPYRGCSPMRRVSVGSPQPAGSPLPTPPPSGPGPGSASAAASRAAPFSKRTSVGVGNGDSSILSQAACEVGSPPYGLASPHRPSVSAPSSQYSHLAMGNPWHSVLASAAVASPAASPRCDSSSTPSSHAHHLRFASRLNDGNSSNSSAASSATPTPRDSMYTKQPRPPGDPAAGPRPRRAPSLTSISNHSPESSKFSSPNDTGVLDLDPAVPSSSTLYDSGPLPPRRVSSSGGHANGNSNGGPFFDSGPLSSTLALAAQVAAASSSSLAPTPSSRPGSGRQRAAGIDALVDAIRSKSDAKLQDAIEAFKQQTGGTCKGLNERHSLTGKTALHEAVLVNNVVMTKLLLKTGADPNVGHAASGPPLIDAASHGETGMVELLLSAHASISATDRNGWTALHHACQVGHASTAHVLISRGADLHQRDFDGATPLDLAPEELRHELVLSGAAASAAAAAAGVGSMTMYHSRPTSGSASTRPRSGGGCGGGAAGVPSPPRPPSAARPPHGAAAAGPAALPSAGGSPLGLTHGAGGGAAPSGSGRSLSRSGSASGRSAPPTTSAPTANGAHHHHHHHPQQQPGASGGGELPLAAVNARLLALKSAGSNDPSRGSTLDSLKSNPSSDLEDKQSCSLSPPPQLELPPRMFRRISSAGADANDMAYAFEANDAEVVQRQREEVTQIFFGTQGHAVAVPAGAGAAMTSSSGPAAGGAQMQQHLSALAAAMPKTPKIGFRVPVAGSSGGSTAAHAAAASQQHQKLISFDSSGTLDTSNGSQIGAAISAAAAAAPPPPPLAGRSSAPAAGPSATADTAAVALRSASAVAALRATAAAAKAPLPPQAQPPAEAMRAAEPPLESDTSPVHTVSPRTSANGGRSSGRRPKAPDVLRISQAVDQLADKIGAPAGLPTSPEALHAMAVEMFKRCEDVQTGTLVWTQGQLIGTGAYGKVYAGLNQKTGELMAVKAQELVRGHNMRAQLDELQKELNICKRLSHKNIVGYIDSQFDDKTSTLYIFLEYVPDGSLSSFLSRWGKLKEELVRKYTRQLLLGLEYLHSQNIMHRDLKGGNVLVTRDGTVKLTDFGTCKVNQETTLNQGARSLKGSPFWMAPEVMEQTQYGRRADIWSLGCTVIEMFTGRHPWADLKVDNPYAAMIQIIQRKAQGPPRPEHCSDVTLDFLDQCFKVDPNARPTASQLLQHPFVAASEPEPRPEPKRADSFEFAKGSSGRRSDNA